MQRQKRHTTVRSNTATKRSISKRSSTKKLTRKSSTTAKHFTTAPRTLLRRRLSTLSTDPSHVSLEPPSILKPKTRLPEQTPNNPNNPDKTAPFNPLDLKEPIKVTRPLFIDKDPLYTTSTDPQKAHDTLHKFAYDIIPSVLGVTASPQINSRHPYLNLYLYTSPAQWQEYLDRTLMIHTPAECFIKELEHQQSYQNSTLLNDDESHLSPDSDQNPTRNTKPPTKFSYHPSLTAPLLSQVTLMTNVHAIDKETPSSNHTMKDIVPLRQINSIKRTSFATPIVLNTDNYNLYRDYHFKHINHLTTGNYNVKHSRIFNPRYITTLLSDPTSFALPSAIQRRIDKNLIYIDSTLETYVAKSEDNSGNIQNRHHNNNNSNNNHNHHNNHSNPNTTDIINGQIPSATSHPTERFQLGHCDAKSDPVHDSGHDQAYDIKHSFKITVPLWFHQKHFLPIYVPERLRVAQELTISQYHDEYLQHKYGDFKEDGKMGSDDHSTETTPTLSDQTESQSESIQKPKLRSHLRSPPPLPPRTSSRPKFIPHDEYYYDPLNASYYPLDKATLNDQTDVIANILKFATISTHHDSPNQWNTRQVVYQFQINEEYYPEFQDKPTWEGLGAVRVSHNTNSGVQSTNRNTQKGLQLQEPKASIPEVEPVFFPPGLEEELIAGGWMPPKHLIAQQRSNSNQLKTPPPSSTKPSKTPPLTDSTPESNNKYSPITTQDYYVFMSSLSKALYSVPDNENFIPENDLSSVSLQPLAVRFGGLPLGSSPSPGTDPKLIHLEDANNRSEDSPIVPTPLASAAVAPVDGANISAITIDPSDKTNIWRIIANSRNHPAENSSDDSKNRLNPDETPNIRLFSDWFHHLIKRDDLNFISTPTHIPVIEIERY